MAPEPQGHGRVVDSDLVTDSDGIVAVPERSSKEIDADVYRTLENSPDFLHLVESGVFSLVQTKRRKYAISAGPYVGEALLESGLRVRVTEKAVGSLASLVRWALPTDLRLTEAPAPIAPEGTALNVFVERFLDHIGGYLREGRLKQYRDEHLISSSPRGRIDLRGTIRSQARGRTDQIAYARPVLSADILVNRLLGRALTAADSYASTHQEVDARTRARTFAALFDDVGIYSFERMPPEQIHQAFAKAFGDPRVAGDLRGALAYGQALILHWGAWTEAPSGTVPKSFFLKLETLFENAVRGVLRKVLIDPVADGADLTSPIFPTRVEDYDADPDLVVGHGQSPPVVGDCKYKQVLAVPGHADVYQLLVHAATLGASSAFLIYPGDRFHVSTLGRSVLGIDVNWVEVRLPHLEADIIRGARSIGLPVDPRGDDGADALLPAMPTPASGDAAP